MSHIKKKMSVLLPNLLIRIAGGYERWQLLRALNHPERAQAATLRSILKKARNTMFGRQHNFDWVLMADSDEELYRRWDASVKASEYEDYRPYVNMMKEGKKDVLFEGSPVLYATTSGSTGEPKWIPISKTYLYDVYGRMTRCTLREYVKSRPKVLSGYTLGVAGKYIEGYTPDGTVFGSVSGFIQGTAPSFIRKRYTAPTIINDIDDYNARNYAIMRMAVERNVTFSMSPNPSTFVELQNNMDQWINEYIVDIENGTLSDKFDIPADIRRQLEKHIAPNPERAQELRELQHRYGRLLPKHVWPNLEILATWKCGNTRIYLRKLDGTLPENTFHQELGYFSSECRFGQVMDDSIESVLFPHFHYYEFKKADELEDCNSRFYTLGELEEGERYVPFVTTYSGLYRYNMNDIVEASKPLFGKTMRIHMVQKVNGIVNITGEKIYEKQFIDAVNGASAQLNCKLSYYVAYANLEESRYDWYFEFDDISTPQEEAEALAAAVDDLLKKSNIEYQSKRDSFRLKDPKVYRLKKHSFDNFKRRVLLKTGRDATRFKPNVLAQNEENHKMMESYVINDEK